MFHSLIFLATCKLYKCVFDETHVRTSCFTLTRAFRDEDDLRIVYKNSRVHAKHSKVHFCVSLKQWIFFNGNTYKERSLQSYLYSVYNSSKALILSNCARYPRRVELTYKLYSVYLYIITINKLLFPWLLKLNEKLINT